MKNNSPLCCALQYHSRAMPLLNEGDLMCYFNQLGLPALIIHQVGELGRPVGMKREGQGVPLIKGFREEKNKKGRKEEIREEEERGDVGD